VAALAGRPPRPQPAHRFAVFGIVLRVAFGLHVSDTHGIKAMNRAAVEPEHRPVAPARHDIEGLVAPFGNPVLDDERFHDLVDGGADPVDIALGHQPHPIQPDREDAEERYSEYLDFVETGTELLAGLRDTFASTMGEAAAEEYEEAFNRAIVKRLPRFALQIEDF